ncbi:MAG TPA: accessory factor UbiK family protein [bacterium]|nr:accessory factor UbiK family protein [bacterium]
MFDPKKLDDVVRRLGEGLPEALTDVRSDVEKTLRLGVQQVLASMDIVTREDFEVQRLVLERTRERLETLEKRVAALEAERASSGLDAEA